MAPNRYVCKVFHFFFVAPLSWIGKHCEKFSVGKGCLDCSYILVIRVDGGSRLIYDIRGIPSKNPPLVENRNTTRGGFLIKGGFLSWNSPDQHPELGSGQESSMSPPSTEDQISTWRKAPPFISDLMEDFPFILGNALYRYGRFPSSLRRIPRRRNLNGGGGSEVKELTKLSVLSVLTPPAASTEDLLHNQWI